MVITSFGLIVNLEADNFISIQEYLLLFRLKFDIQYVQEDLKIKTQDKKRHDPRGHITLT